MGGIHGITDGSVTGHLLLLEQKSVAVEPAILLTSIDQEEPEKGYDLESFFAVCEAVNVPVIWWRLFRPCNNSRQWTLQAAPGASIADALHWKRTTIATSNTGDQAWRGGSALIPVTVLDYGIGNLTVSPALSSTVARMCKIDPWQPGWNRPRGHLVLPQLCWCLPDAMNEIRHRGFDDLITSHVNAQRPFLGICVGYAGHVFPKVREYRRTEGLGLIEGAIGAGARNRG